MKKEKTIDKYFEEFKVGDKIIHSNGRTIIDTDNVWVTNITLNTNQIHFNNDYASKTSFKKPLVNSCFTFMLITGLSSDDFGQSSNIIKWQGVRMPNPLYVGETVYAESKIVNKYDASDIHKGCIEVKTRGVTETGKIIMEFSSLIELPKANIS